jgi:hypothetical protein
MTIHKVEVSEYICETCGYRWINRINGKEGPVPKRCTKCKSKNWNDEKISPQERGLRRRVRGFKELYDELEIRSEGTAGKDAIIGWPNGLIEKFLNLKPRPTILELNQVIDPKGLVLRPLDSQNQFNRFGYVPDPTDPEMYFYDPRKYARLRKYEAQRRQEAMLKIIESRPR